MTEKPIGKLEKGRIADVPFFEEKDLTKIVEDTGLQLHPQVCRTALLQALNNLVHTSVDWQLTKMATSEELRKLKKHLDEYNELSRHLSRSNCPPLLMDQRWYRNASNRLVQYMDDLSSNSKRGRRRQNVLLDQFLPQALGIYFAAFDRKPVQTEPAFPDEIERAKADGNMRKASRKSAQGSTVKYVRVLLKLTLAEICRRNNGSCPEQLSEFDCTKAPQNKAISSWIKKVQDYRTSDDNEELYAFFERYDHKDWRVSKEQYLSEIRTLASG